MDEKRTLQRFTMTLPVRVSRIANGKEPIMVLQTFNICSQGAFLEPADRFAVGTRLKMDFFLQFSHSEAKDDIIRTTGEIIRTDTSGIAVQFDETYQILPIRYFPDQ